MLVPAAAQMFSCKSDFWSLLLLGGLLDGGEGSGVDQRAAWLQGDSAPQIKMQRMIIQLLIHGSGEG